MSSDVSDLSYTIVPKSDQLNAEQLLNGPITITVTDVRVGASEEQPVSVFYADDPSRPYKPCKTMRKLLVFAWGSDGRAWVGRSMTLFNEPEVKFGGQTVGGIRISHLSDIKGDIKVSLTATKGKKALHSIERLNVARPPAAVDHGAALRDATSIDDLKSAFKAAYRSTSDESVKAAFKTSYDKRLATLMGEAS